MKDQIKVRGAQTNNLKNIDVDIPRNQLVVFTGLSGSGKSSLAFDTIYAEGQRRYVESLSAYARQFLGQMDKPDVDSIEGLSPAISIDQKRPVGIPVQLLEQLRKYMIICDYYMLVLVTRFVRTMALKSPHKPLNRWSIVYWNIRSGPGFKS